MVFKIEVFLFVIGISPGGGSSDIKGRRYLSKILNKRYQGPILWALNLFHS